MATVTQKLNQIKAIKDDLRSAINSASSAEVVTHAEPFRNYPDLLRDNAVGGSTGYTSLFSITGDFTNYPHNIGSVLISKELVSIPEGAFVASTDQTAFFCVVKNLVFTGSLNRIGQGAFYGWTSLIAITFQGNVIEIQDRAFEFCFKLESVIFPDGLITLGESAFLNNMQLGLIDIPSTIQSIGRQCFYNTKNGAVIYIRAMTPPTLLGEYCFGDSQFINVIYVPQDALSAYLNAGGEWANYASKIQPIL
ncbi:hypothetical protein F965_00489 [Acinetobacter schindleri NIPH 900]|uniref:Leucine-rich repeat domain-containing protein n=1 Tax=Acinetobacter schindleri NIPH 900 TaxID=1217675 RepID=N8WQJ4_9GAMM|nr:leucine-rich repeat domain-containing protein [Acinetobacter schindleri]ENV14246.1 hypothetical protein F965_00489 [Acinetobacter schindleri NIPH 900]